MRPLRNIAIRHNLLRTALAAVALIYCGTLSGQQTGTLGPGDKIHYWMGMFELN